MSQFDSPALKKTGGAGFLGRLRANAESQMATIASPSPASKAAPGAMPASPTERRRERFIPVTRFGLIEKLTEPQVWPEGPAQAAEARRFFRYIDYWRQQQYNAKLFDLDQCYEPFSPDSDLISTRTYSEAELAAMRHKVVAGVEDLLVRANYERVNPHELDVIMTPDSAYGLDLHVDMDAFEEIIIYRRGMARTTNAKRSIAKFGRKHEVEVPIFQRLFILFKLKPFDLRVKNVMARNNIERSDAERRVKKMRAHLPESIKDDRIYLKLFKNIPCTDLEMVFPNTQVRFRPFDKLKLGVSAGGGLGMGAVGAAGKIALLATNPLAAAGAVLGLGGVAARQASAFVNQKQKYMVTMARNLYFHSMADNRGVILKIAARGAEEDIKEEILLYSVLAKEKASRADMPAIDQAIEHYLLRTFGVTVDFEIDDALDRLIRDGIVTEAADGTFKTLAPAAAAAKIDAMWDQFLDHLPEPKRI
jgi:hypothetical protein